jgi:transcription initiation factor TFIIB
MNYDDIFDKYNDKYNDQNKKVKKKNCCDNIDNYSINKSIIICKICNNTITNITDTPEWRYYGSEDSKNSDPTRCGMALNPLLPDSSVGTSIKRGANKPGMFQVKQYQKWTSMSYKERSMFKVFTDIENTCNKYNLPKIIIIESKSLYKLTSETKISRGNNRIGIIAACVYFACKNCNVGRSSKEISEMFNIKINIFTKGCKNFQNILQLSKEKTRVDTSDSISYIDFIDRFCNRLNINKIHTENIKKLSKDVENLNILNDIRPDSFASGVILYYCNKENLNCNKNEISSYSKISEVTINKCFKKIENILD